MRRLLALTALIAITACGNSSAPPAPGRLDGRIVAGQNQRVIAGIERLPDRVVEEVVRVPLTAAAYRQNRIEDWFLPQLAFAQTTDKAKIANAVLCVKNDQFDMVPLIQCANTDSVGNAAWVFLMPTKVGAYEAHTAGTFGNEIIDVDTVRAVVEADAPDPFYRTQSLPLQCSPAVFPIDGVRDKYGNAIPYRIVPDKRLTVGGDAIGAVESRTVTYTVAQADTIGQPPTWYTLDLHIANEALGGRIKYHIGSAGQGPGGCHQIQWEGYGISVTP